MFTKMKFLLAGGSSDCYRNSSPTKNFNRNVGVFFMFKDKSFIGRWFFRLLSELIAHQKIRQKCWSFFMFKNKSFIGRWFFRLLSELIAHQKLQQKCWSFLYDYFVGGYSDCYRTIAIRNRPPKTSTKITGFSYGYLRYRLEDLF